MTDSDVSNFANNVRSLSKRVRQRDTECLNGSDGGTLQAERENLRGMAIAGTFDESADKGECHPDAK